MKIYVEFSSRVKIVFDIVNIFSAIWYLVNELLIIWFYKFLIINFEFSGSIVLVVKKCFATVRNWKTRETMWWASQQWRSHLIQYWCSIFYLTNQELPDSQTNYKLDVLCEYFSNFQTCLVAIIALEVSCFGFGLFEIVSWGILVSLGAGSTLLSLGLPGRLGSTLCESLGLLGSALGSGLLGGGSQLLGSWGLLDKLSWCCSGDNCCSFIWNLCNISCGLRGWVPEINRDLLILVYFLVWLHDTLRAKKF